MEILATLSNVLVREFNYASGRSHFTFSKSVKITGGRYGIVYVGIPEDGGFEGLEGTA
jgi:hypothetical protein